MTIWTVGDHKTSSNLLASHLKSETALSLKQKVQSLKCVYNFRHPTNEKELTNASNSIRF